MTAASALRRTGCHDTEHACRSNTGRPTVSVWFRAASAVPPERPEPLLTVPEACAALRVSKWTLYQLIRRRQLATIKIGSRRCIPVASVQALIERLRSEGSTL